MRLLGAVLAGGAARRFGRDKALAAIAGRPMLDYVAARLAAECLEVVVAGRDWPGLVRVDDVPEPGLGPLGGLAGALAYAAARGFHAVLTSGCDLPGLPAGLAGLLGVPDAVVQGQPTIGLWHAHHAEALRAYLAAGGDRSIRGWAAACGARRVALGEALANINTPEEHAAYLRAAGLSGEAP